MEDADYSRFAPGASAAFPGFARCQFPARAASLSFRFDPRAGLSFARALRDNSSVADPHIRLPGRAAMEGGQSP